MGALQCISLYTNRRYEPWGFLQPESPSQPEKGKLNITSHLIHSVSKIPEKMNSYLWQHCSNTLAPKCLWHKGGHEIHLLLTSEFVLKHRTVLGPCGQSGHGGCYTKFKMTRIPKESMTLCWFDDQSHSSCTISKSNM